MHTPDQPQLSPEQSLSLFHEDTFNALFERRKNV